ncbi:MAG: Rdx family protein [Armatimonadota bacterium]|nr:Rdx family protein [Armatimonadota bacterium]
MAEELINGLQQPVGTAHPIAKVVLVPGSRGIFEVRKDGKLIFSKQEAGRKPEAGEITRLVLA